MPNSFAIPQPLSAPEAPHSLQDTVQYCRASQRTYDAKRGRTNKILPKMLAKTVRTAIKSQRKMTAVDSIIATTRSAVESSSR